MIRTCRRWAWSAFVVAVAFNAHAASPSELIVRLDVHKSVVVGDVDVFVNVTVTNPTRSMIWVPKAQLPSQDHDGALLNITRDGHKVAYLGRMIKRGPASEVDVIKVGPGATLSYPLELTGAYDLSENGRYAIEYVGHTKQNASHSAVPTSATYLWLEGRTQAFADAQLLAKPATNLAGSVTYTGNCTATQKTSLGSALTAARNYAANSKTYLSATPSATTRYVTWFGAYSLSRWNTAKAHFVSEVDAFNNKPLTLDCSCKQSYYAYVYPTKPYKIYLCNAFWTAPTTGTDSKAGTLVHEMSHFNVVAATDDWAYGQSAAKSLAISNPTKALDNADSHEYFAENTPSLP